MATVKALPFDILLEILLLSPTLRDLHALILSNRTCYSTFLERRDNIIGAVFCHQIVAFRRYGKLADNDEPHWHKAIVIVHAVEKRNRHDGMVLRASLYPLASKNFPEDWSLKWLVSYVRGYKELDIKTDRMMKVLNKAWTAIDNKVIKVKGNFPTKFYRYARFIVDTYYNENRDEEALELQKYIHSQMDCRRNDEVHNRWGGEIVEYLRRNNRNQEALSYERLVYQRCREKAGPGAPATLEWARHVLRELTLADRFPEALREQFTIFSNIRSNNVSFVPWARQLIIMQKKAGRFEEALMVKAEVWQRLSSDNKCYYGWARELMDEYHKVGRKEEALGVARGVWDDVQRQLARRPNDKTLLFHERNARIALVKEYRGLGRVEQASALTV